MKQGLGHIPRLKGNRESQGSYNRDENTALNYVMQQSFAPQRNEQILQLSQDNSLTSSLPSPVSIDQLLGKLRRMPLHTPVKTVLYPHLADLDARSVGVLVKQLANGPHPNQAWDLFNWLREQQKERPELCRLLDVYVYTTMISLCAGKRDMNHALELCREMRSIGIDANVHTFSTLMNVAIKCGQLQRALDLYKQMQEEGCEPNVVTYNTLIDVYGKTGQWTEAIKVLDMMTQKGIRPVTRTFNTVMIALNSSSQWQQALAVHQRMVDAGVAPNTTTFNALISAHSKAGRLDQVMSVFKQMVTTGCERSVITYTSLINACERAGDWARALDLFYQMREENVVPNVVTFNSLITACAQGGQWMHAAEVFDVMKASAVPPDVMTYTALINAYERGGQWQRALQAFNELHAQGSGADAILYTTIIDALWDAGSAGCQAAAMQLYRAAVKHGVLRGPGVQQIRSEEMEVVLVSLAAGVAMATLKAWLADLMDLMYTEGLDALPQKFTITLGKARHREYGSVAAVREAVTTWLTVRSAPFKESLIEKRVRGSSAEGAHHGPVMHLSALGQELGVWLSEPLMQIDLAPFHHSRTTGGLPSYHALDADLILSSSCSATFAQATQIEAAQLIHLSTLNAHYLEQRMSLVDMVVQVVSSTEWPLEMAHDSVALMDRWASRAGPLTMGLPLLCIAVACLMLRMTVDAAGMQNFLASKLSLLTGIPPEQITSIALSVATLLNFDVSAISPLRVAGIYVSRLSSDGQSATNQEVFSPFAVSTLLAAAIRTPNFVAYRPTITAAAAVYVHRSQSGMLPVWPGVLAHLTGLQPTTSQELKVALQEMTRLGKQLGRADSGDRMGLRFP